jgi:hypothetical protein
MTTRYSRYGAAMATLADHVISALQLEQAKSFSLYAIHTILAGRADELLDLVTTNVARRILH